MRGILLVLVCAAGACADRPIDVPDPVEDASVGDLAQPIADLSVGSDGPARDLAVPLDLASPIVCSVSPCALEVVVAGDASCARMSDGTVRCWGDNQSGQLGTGVVSGSPPIVSPSSLPSPSPIAGLSGVSGVGLGGFFGPIAAGCALVGGQVECWGSNEFGELGRGGPTVNQVVPSLVFGPYLPSPAPVVQLAGVYEIAVGGNYACARAGGDVSCWGSFDGATVPVDPGGDGSPVFYQPTPFAVPLPRPARRIFVAAISAQAADGSIVCALLDDATLDCVGASQVNEFGGPGFYGPQPVPIPPAIDVAIGEFHACAVSEAGEVYCWGSTDWFARGDGLLDGGYRTVSKVPLPAPATHVTAGYQSSCALLADGTVACWGFNSHLQCGQPSGDPVPQPERVAGLGDVVALSHGTGWHVCAIERSGRVVCWGGGDAGALEGAATTAVPVEIRF